MKKRILSILLLIFLLLHAIPTFAANFTIDSLKLNLTVPDNWYTVTRETKAHDTVFDQLAIKPSDFFTFINENNIYLNAFSSDSGKEIVLTMTEDDDTKKIFTYSDYSVDYLNSIAEKMILNSTASFGTILSDSGWYQTEQAKYVKFKSMQTNTYNTIYSQQYLTMYNGMRFTISLHSYNGELSDTDTAILQTVVDSLHFTETLENPNGISKKSQTDYYSVIRTGSLAASLGVILLGILGILISRQKNKRIKS